MAKEKTTTTSEQNDFLPMTAAEMTDRGWDRPDFVYVSGDAYVDHPSFGVAIISRVLEAAGFRVAILAQPDFTSCEDFKRFGLPRLGFLVTAGNIDSMVAHYTVANKRRTYDYYSPGGKMGKRPDRALIVYCNRIREAYGDVPIILGGLEASLRRFAHYDYWQDKVRRSVLLDSRADLLTYGMGENILVRVAKLLDRGVPIHKIRDVRGTCYVANPEDPVHFPVAAAFDFAELKENKEKYAAAFGIQYKNQDAVTGGALVEKYDNKVLVQNPPMPPLEREELDRVYALPYMRNYPPCYESDGGVPAIAEVKFSVTHNRGCFGGCNFCALAFHQGRSVRSRSEESVVREAELLTKLPDFKGYIHDVGGPTANFRAPACEKQLKAGVCTNRKCLVPHPCPNLKVDHSEYVHLLSAVEAVPGVKKVFIRSGIRFDYVMADKNDAFFKKLVTDHVSGQLKVAPEHCSSGVLSCMGKPDFTVYEAFRKKFFELTGKAGLEQYLTPYLMSSHPGSTLADALELALYLKKNHYAPEQVQDFYPTPGTASTVMFYTGINPLDGSPVYVATDPHEKRLQRALLQYNRPANASLVREALERLGREDLIGNGPECLVKGDGNAPKKPTTQARTEKEQKRTGTGHGGQGNRRPAGKPNGPAKPNASGKAYGQGKPHGAGKTNAQGKPNGQSKAYGQGKPAGQTQKKNAPMKPHGQAPASAQKRAPQRNANAKKNK